MSAKRRFAALLAAIFIVSLMPRTAADGGQNATRPMRRAMKQVEKDELAIFKPIIEADFKVIEKALSKPPKSKERGVKAWGLIVASDTAIYGALGLSGGKKTVSDDYGALFKKEKEDYTKDHNMWMAGGEKLTIPALSISL
ncbi:hypothetical protein AGMMS49957_19000 [Synergistales bacterium]|nr:hypothetical protein AGMMS49957_19000 [Synergistales bacterium]